jgi:hypothetical protein
VELWDSESSGVESPPAVWDRDAAAPLGALRGHNDGASRIVVDPGSRTITVADLARRAAVVYSPAATTIPSWWRAMPMRVLLGWAVAGPRRHLVHAGAVGIGDDGVLLGGSGGAGKSTAAVACVEAGMSFASDDYVALTAGEPPRAHAVYGTVKLDREALRAFPSLAEAAVPSADAQEKAVVDLHALRRDRMAPSLAVRAIVIPRIAPGERTGIRPLSGAQAMRALAPSTIFQAPDGRHDALRVISTVVRQVPSYQLSIGAERPDIAGMIRSVLERDA